MTQPAARPSAEATMALLKGRRSIRRYRPEPVPDETIAQLLEAGRVAPSASNRQPWHFIVVRDETIRARLTDEGGIAIVRWRFMKNAPLIIVLCGDASRPLYRSFLHEDVGLAGSQIMLQAHAMGLGTCWVGGLNKKKVASIMGLPEHIEVIGLLAVGFPDESPKPRPRKPLEEIVHYEQFGRRTPDGSIEPAAPVGGWLQRLKRLVRISLN